MDSDKAKADIELLAKLLNADKSNQNDIFADERNAFYTALEKDFRDAISKSTMPNQEKIFNQIREIGDGMELFSYIPSLLGKTLIGIVDFDIDLTKPFLRCLFGETVTETVLKNTKLPCVLTLQNPNIIVTNDTGSQFVINTEEFIRINSDLKKYKVDICSFLRIFFISCELSFQHIGIIYFPPYLRADDSFNQSIMQKIDTMFVFSSSSLAQQKLWQTIKYVCNVRQIPCHIIAERINEELAGEAISHDFYATPQNEVDSILNRLNIPRNNGLLTDDIELPLIKIRKFYEDNLHEIETNQKLMANDLTYITMQDTKKAVRDLVEETRKQKSQLEENYRLLQRAMHELLSKAKDYESALQAKLCSMGNNETTFSASQNTLNTWSDLFLAFVDLRDLQNATNYLMKLKKYGHPLEYIHDMILKSVKGEDVPVCLLNRLRQERDTEFVRRSKMRLMDLLGFSEIDYMRIARDINNPQTHIELYYRGRWEESENHLEKAIDYYMESLKKGSTNAGCRLMALTKKSSGISLKMLADEMIPEANYALGMEFRQNKKFTKSNRYFKLAAAKGHLPSIKILTDGLFFGLRERSTRGLCKQDIESANNAIRLYQYILEQDHTQIDAKEKIGDLYHILNDDRRALDYWRQCNTATAYYHRGKLFQYPDGSFRQDLDEALECFKKASSLGLSIAGAEYRKVLKWKEQNAARQVRCQQEQRNYAPRVVETPRVKESSGCFITSAVCTALNKPDDCEELTALRAYRDQSKEADPAIASLIAEYYRVAPLIVSIIDKDEHAASIYQNLWDSDISVTYHLVKEGKYREATLRYIDMTIRLCNQYQVSLEPRILEVVEAMHSDIDAMP